MLSDNFALCKTILNKHNIVFSMQFVSYGHSFRVRMLKTFWTQSFPPNCICQPTAVSCSPVVPYVVC